jgi:hypothetical protein
MFLLLNIWSLLVAAAVVVVLELAVGQADLDQELVMQSLLETHIQ